MAELVVFSRALPVAEEARAEKAQRSILCEQKANKIKSGTARVTRAR